MISRVETVEYIKKKVRKDLLFILWFGVARADWFVNKNEYILKKNYARFEKTWQQLHSFLASSRVTLLFDKQLQVIIFKSPLSALVEPKLIASNRVYYAVQEPSQRKWNSLYIIKSLNAFGDFLINYAFTMFKKKKILAKAFKRNFERWHTND